MKCPHCQERLGLNDICINPACSYFGTIINSSEKSDLNNTENNLGNIKSSNIQPNSYTTNTNFNNNDNNSGFNNNNNNNNSQSLNKDNYTPDNISKEEFVAFIGPNNTNYYLGYVDKMNNNNSFLSWNWACFFLSAYWLLYRKLYAIAAIFFIVNVSLSLLIPGALSFIIRIVLSMFANAIYLNHSTRKIKNVKTIIANLSTTQYFNILHKKGGVNLVAPFILIGIYILVIVIIVVISLSRTGIIPHNFSSPSYHY